MLNHGDTESILDGFLIISFGNETGGSYTLFVTESPEL
jgi:hypothetical protein